MNHAPNLLRRIMLTVLAAIGASPAHAALTGDAIGGELFTQAAGGFSSNVAVVGPGIEFTKHFSHPNLSDPPVTTLDVDDNAFTLTITNPITPDNSAGCGSPDCRFNGGFLGFELTGLDWVNEPTREIAGLVQTFSNFPVDAFTSIAYGPHSVDVTFDPAVVLIPGFGTQWQASWSVVTQHPVPLPAALPMMVPALVGFGCLARRRRGGGYA